MSCTSATLLTGIMPEIRLILNALRSEKDPKDKLADHFSDDDMNQIRHFGQVLGGGVTPL